METIDVVGVNVYSWRINFERLERRAEEIVRLKEVWIRETWWGTQRRALRVVQGLRGAGA